MSGAQSPLQNRVTPFGDVVAIAQRGLFIGNRGIIHDPATKTLLGRRWTTKAWLVCLLDYKGRHRKVMPQLDRAILSRRSGGARRRSPPVLLVSPQGRRGISCRLGKRERREGASGTGDGCGTAPRAAGPRPQTNPSHTWSCRRAAGWRCDRRLHHRARSAVPLDRARLSSGATNPSRRWVADPTVDMLAIGAGYRPALHPDLENSHF